MSNQTWRIGIGIDTGGTYTDAVIYERQSQRILARGKARTTKEDLKIGILGAIDTLPQDLVVQAQRIALSTTLATNACVEGKGGCAKLVLLGINETTLRHSDVLSRYGFDYEDALPVNIKSSFDGSFVEHPDWQQLFEDHEDYFAQAHSFGIAELNAPRNGGVAEAAGKEALQKHYGVPVIMASDISSGVNVLERGATALLNARLLPIIQDFLDATLEALSQRGIKGEVMIMLSDGGLVQESFARSMPVETIISGPAASVAGSRHLSQCNNCLIVDMGGTTTDVSIIEKGSPALTSKVRIGDWRAHIPGVFMDTFALGGDTQILVGEYKPELGTRRVEPICAMAARWPHLVEEYRNLIINEHWIRREMYETLYLLREPRDEELQDANEKRLVELLKQGPVVIGRQEEFEPAHLIKSKFVRRLEDEGIIMRAGLTPTDMMHIKGDFAQGCTEASLLVARYFCGVCGYGIEPDDLLALANDIYELVEKRIYVNLTRLLIEWAEPGIFDQGISPQIIKMLENQWQANRGRSQGQGQDRGQGQDCDQGYNQEEAPVPFLRLDAHLSLVGLGAPTHLFLPAVARAMGVECIIPEDAAVANAIGAITSNISAQVSVTVDAQYSPEGIEAYLVRTAQGTISFTPYQFEEALTVGRQEALAQAQALARSRGATGPLITQVEEQESKGTSAEGLLYLSTTFTAQATMEQA